MDLPAPLLTKAEVAEHLHVTVRTVDRLIAAGEIKAVRLGHRTTRVHPDSVDAYLVRCAA